MHLLLQIPSYKMIIKDISVGDKFITILVAIHDNMHSPGGSQMCANRTTLTSNVGSLYLCLSYSNMYLARGLDGAGQHIA